MHECSSAVQRSLQVCDRRGNILVNLPFPLQDFILRQGPGSAARVLAWDADGTQLAVLPRSQASVLLWARDQNELAELTPGRKAGLALCWRMARHVIAPQRITSC